VGKQVTEMLKGSLEGTVLAILSDSPAYGYEITARLGDVEKVPSEKGPPRKVYSLNARGRAHLDEFWETWSFLAGRLDQLRHEGN
jgi:PadR family transcriptional regulator PadR